MAAIALLMIPIMYVGVGLVIWLLAIITMWKIYAKGGQPGWAIFIPIYNAVCMVRIGGYSGWFCLLFVVPLVNIIFGILLAIRIAEHFGHTALFGIGLVFLPIIFYPILAWSRDEWSPA